MVGIEGSKIFGVELEFCVCAKVGVMAGSSVERNPFDKMSYFRCRTEEIEGLIQEIKSNDEKLQVMNADIAVMKLLLGETVEETVEKSGECVARYFMITNDC